MLRKIIKIDQEKCNGCGLCVNACHEGALALVDGKAALMRDDYCDGLGDCLPQCPTGAITFEMREAAAYDQAAVAAKNGGQPKGCPGSMAKTITHSGCPGSMAKTITHGGCPGSMAKVINHSGCPGSAVKTFGSAEPEQNQVPQTAGAAYQDGNLEFVPESQLRQWPVQIKLVPVHAPYFNGAHLLVAADCTAYAYANFHRDFIKNKITLIGCPKLDQVDYSEKLTAIIKENEVKSVTIVRMEVPCCGGLENAAKKALQASGKFIPWQVVTISTDGKILD